MKKNNDSRRSDGNDGRNSNKAAEALAGVLFIQIDPERLKTLGIEGWEEASLLPVQTPGQLHRFEPSMIRDRKSVV